MVYKIFCVHNFSLISQEKHTPTSSLKIRTPKSDSRLGGGGEGAGGGEGEEEVGIREDCIL